jgi:catechol 2,3-dioxygenase-like lactoylglutathione lyase family enzyme
MSSSSRSPLCSIAPLFIVGSLAEAIAFYRDQLGFELDLMLPEEGPFFAIVRRGGAQLLLKEIGEGTAALPNPERHADARWDAFVGAPDPDSLAGELAGRGVIFSAPLADGEDGLRGFELRDRDGHVLFFGRPLGGPGAAPAAVLRAVQPVLMVRDVARSILFYDGLGFRLAFRDDAERPRRAPPAVARRQRLGAPRRSSDISLPGGRSGSAERRARRTWRSARSQAGLGHSLGHPRASRPRPGRKWPAVLP